MVVIRRLNWLGYVNECSLQVCVAVMSLAYKFVFSWFGAHILLQLFKLFGAHLRSVA